MSADKFDEELQQLYQQRKSQFTAPAVNIHQAKVAKATMSTAAWFQLKPARSKSVKSTLTKTLLTQTKYSLAAMFAITCTASIASFGIFVIIEQLIAQPKITAEQSISVPIIDVEQIQLTTNSDEVLQKSAPRTTKPAQVSPANALLVNSKKPTSVPAIDSIKEPQQPFASLTTPELSTGLVSAMTYQVISVPSIEPPKAAVIPIYKEMPKYHAKAVKQQHTGVITLRYQIDNYSGDVKNINVVSSSVSNVLKKSAKKALSNWQYQGEQEYREHYQVTFEFKLSNTQ